MSGLVASAISADPRPLSFEALFFTEKRLCWLPVSSREPLSLPPWAGVVRVTLLAFYVGAGNQTLVPIA